MRRDGRGRRNIIQEVLCFKALASSHTVTRRKRHIYILLFVDMDDSGRHRIHDDVSFNTVPQLLPDCPGRNKQRPEHNRRNKLATNDL